MKKLFQWPNQITSSVVQQLMRAEKDVKKALVVFDAATAEYSNGFRHDCTTFGLMITKLVVANQFSLAEQLLDRMKRENCKVTEDIMLTVLRGYGRVHRPLDSVRMFHKMIDFDCIQSDKSYVTVLSILVDENHLKLAMRFYKYMKKKGVSTSVVALNVLMKALCKSPGSIENALAIFEEMPNRGLHPDAITYGTLINGLCKQGNINAAKELFKQMKIAGCSPSVVTYTSLINGLCKSKSMDEALILLKEMDMEGIQPNVITYSSLIDGLCKDGNSLQAMEMMEFMIRKRIRANSITYSSLVDGLCKEKRISEAVEVFDRMKLQGIKPDAGLYGKIINVFCGAEKFQEAANFIDEMGLEGIPCNRVTWSLLVGSNNKVVQGLCLNGNPGRAFQLYLSMRTRKILVHAGTHSVLLLHFSKKGELQKAVRVLDELVLDGCVPEEGWWKILVKSCCNRRKVREECEGLMDLLTSDEC